MEKTLNARGIGQSRPLSGQFADWPIQRKMLAITLLICGAVLCVAITALFAFQVFNFRSNFKRDAAALAVVIANNSTAALAFSDEKTGAEIIGALQAKPSVVSASLVLPEGSLFAGFGKPENARSLNEFPPPGEQRFLKGQLLVTQAVILKREPVGFLFLRMDYHRTFSQLLGMYLSVLLGVTIVSVGLAVLLSRRLVRRITGPILQLAAAAQDIGEKKDYSLRAEVPAGADEVGRLARSFNDMLEQLDGLNRQLMSTSRLAGMAEVATGVLHNVGNVLNSVSVSATVAADRLRNSKLPRLRQAVTMIREKNGGLADFLVSDPKGKLLPEYLDAVSGQMAADHAKLLEHLDTVGRHVEHVKEIVAMQQSYAKVSGVYENLSLASLVEDALRMNTAAFERHGVTVIREMNPEIPSVCVDRHKTLQILINLLRNAKYALDELDPPEKRLVIRVERPADGRARVVVSDNGIGIPPENLNRIFNHGFTTRKNGHGFGLHSGANAAREMGGTLKAASEGHGKGAEFTLELPVATQHPSQAQLQKS